MTDTAVAIALQKAPIPLKPKLKEEDYRMVTLTNMVGNHKRKAELPKITTRDVELITKAVLDFEDIARPSRLNLNTAALLFDKFREVTQGTFRTKFDQLRANNPATVQGFRQAKDQFLFHYVTDTALEEEQAYLDSARKPYNTSVTDLGERIAEINRLMAKFPGAGDAPPYNERQLKNVLYKMMLDTWKVNFATSVNRLNDPAYTFHDLVDYMETQACAFNARRGQRKRNTDDPRAGRGGRGRDYRGGRGRGRFQPS